MFIEPGFEIGCKFYLKNVKKGKSTAEIEDGDLLVKVSAFSDSHVLGSCPLTTIADGGVGMALLFLFR